MSDVSGSVVSSASQKKNTKQNASFSPTPEVTALWKAVYEELRTEFGEAVSAAG